MNAPLWMLRARNLARRRQPGRPEDGRELSLSDQWAWDVLTTMYHRETAQVVPVEDTEGAE